MKEPVPTIKRERSNSLTRGAGTSAIEATVNPTTRIFPIASKHFNFDKRRKLLLHQKNITDIDAPPFRTTSYDTMYAWSIWKHQRQAEEETDVQPSPQIQVMNSVCNGVHQMSTRGVEVVQPQHLPPRQQHQQHHNRHPLSANDNNSTTKAPLNTVATSAASQSYLHTVSSSSSASASGSSSSAASTSTLTNAHPATLHTNHHHHHPPMAFASLQKDLSDNMR